ncbi:tetratricopeptide repeat protein [Nocardia yamanashiensis]|uniref:tetratricopeptide repeat protein n=1 Tax=Nocardia yamanashiensis TaxID=209247 RepID=UPI001E37497F|nr:tetratricopeptide repeat protein [Nocardia yamanashiensis]UGT43323.1 tetratricopeptide repeat protein [Nocardia yamanashiensis]
MTTHAPTDTRVLAVVDADHRLRGPYSATGSLLRAIAPDLLDHHPDLIQRHDVELIAAAPELADLIRCRRATLMATAAPEERTRYYPAAYTQRLANGIVDLLSEYCRRRAGGPWQVVIHNAALADPTDEELLAILVRRADPSVLQVVIHPGGDVAEHLATSATMSAVQHNQCAAELIARKEFSLHLGAIPFHLERGSDPGGAGAEANERALQHCVMQGYYDATIRFGQRVLELLDWERDPQRCWLATVKMCTALAALNRPAEAEELYDEACRRSTLPSVHLHAAYGRAMLYTRFYAGNRDHARAKAWINTAIAIASLGSEKQRRAYNLTFQENGRALIEMHLGNLAESLRLVENGLARLDAEVDPGRFDPHRSVLSYNRAQLLARIGSPQQALDAYATVIAMDPNHSEYYGERAGLYRKLGQIDSSLADYAHAIALSPPYPQVHFNRGDLLMELADYAGAIADFERALELDDTLVDAYVNRAACHLELGDLDAASRDVESGLALDPDQAELHCVRGMIEQQHGRSAAARHAFDRARRLDPTLVAAWANAGVLAFDDGDTTESIACFDRALAIDDDPVVRANRGIAHASRGDHAQAVADFGAALAAGDPDSAPELLYRRGLIELRSGDPQAGLRDLRASAAATDDEFAQRARAELARIATAAAPSD